MTLEFKWHSTKRAIILHSLIALFAWVPWLVSARVYIGGFPSLFYLYIVLTLYGVAASIIGLVQRNRTIKELHRNSQTKKSSASFILILFVTLNAIITIPVPCILYTINRVHSANRIREFEEQSRDWNKRHSKWLNERKVLENKLYYMDSIELIDFIREESLDYCTTTDYREYPSSPPRPCKNGRIIHLNDSTDYMTLRRQILEEKTRLLELEYDLY